MNQNTIKDNNFLYIKIRKLLLVLLFLCQTIISLLANIIILAVNFKKEVVPHNFGIFCMVLGITIGSYCFGRWKRKKYTELLNDKYVKKLSLCIAIINMIIVSFFSIVFMLLGEFEKIGLIGMTVLFIVVNIIVFLFYYFGTKSWLKRGVDRS
jgi:Kef-type K+ transport system membrane component KefB